MKFLLILLFFSAVLADPYSSVLSSINSYTSQLPQQDDYTTKVKQIPQYDMQSGTYDHVVIKDLEAESLMINEYLPQLEASAYTYKNPEALVSLGDIYTFGNMSITANYSKALNYYEQAVNIKSHGHAYFMLGFMYSTGMFGEIEPSQAKAQLYYQLGVEQDDINCLLVMAYKLSQGIGVPKNCELSLVYYSRLAQFGYDYLKQNEDHFEPTETSFNLKLPDFVDGIYGKAVSESPTSVVTSKKKLLNNFEQDFEMDIFDKKIVINYVSALYKYDGYYNSKKDYSRAKALLQDCADYGEELNTYKNLKSLSDDDKFRLSKCLSLLGHMFLKGQGTEKDYKMAQKYLTNSISIYKNNTNALSDLGYMYEKNYVEESKDNLQKAVNYYRLAISDPIPDSKSSRRLSQLLISQIQNGDIMASPSRSDIVQGMRDSALKGDVEALYHYAEFIQQGLTRGIQPHSCASNVFFFKIFLERLDKLFYPSLKYALEQINNYNYKNALLGYSIAAEQGVERAQISAGWLLYQLDTFPIKGTKTFNHDRVKLAMRYFQRASDQGDIDSTIFLGDIYYHGIESANVAVNYDNAFKLYSKAAHLKSPHGCFSVAYMYEHGLGVANNTLDYFMAKRYYDLSLKYRDPNVSNNIPIYFALLKLRIKYLIWGQKVKSEEQSSWFSNFKKLGDDNSVDERAQARAQNQHETSIFFEDDDFEIGDYLALGVAFIVFGMFIIRNMILQYRRLRNGNPNRGADENANNGDANNGFDNGNGEGENQGENQNPPANPANPEGWDFNGNGIHFRRGNFEFQFFAL